MKRNLLCNTKPSWMPPFSPAPTDLSPRRCWTAKKKPSKSKPPATARNCSCRRRKPDRSRPSRPGAPDGSCLHDALLTRWSKRSKCASCSLCRGCTPFPPMCRKCAKMCRQLKTEKSHEESCDSSWDFGALVGTRIPGPLIKSAICASIVYIGTIGLSQFCDVFAHYI